MNKDQIVALSDASERLIYAYVSGSQREIEAANQDLRLAKEMAGERPSAAVIARLIKNDPLNAAAHGLITYPELQDIIAPNPSRYLRPDEVAAVADNPANLRTVLAARMSGGDLAELIREPLLNQQDFALAARGDRRQAAMMVKRLRAGIDKSKKK